MPGHPLLIVTDGLIRSGDSIIPHPELDLWQEQFSGYLRSWFNATSRMPVEWYTELAGCDASLPGTLIPAEERAGFAQFWIASPFHARLNHDRLHVMPDAILPWSEIDAGWLCDLLNPLLQEEGMKLAYHQSLLFLLCSRPLDARPVSFAEVSGVTLPDRHPDGADGGALMRLTAEIQMMLRGNPATHRHEAGAPDVDGLWLWGGSPIASDHSPPSLAVATRNPMLRSLAEAQDAGVTITEADRLTELVRTGQPLPKRIVLAGGGCAVLLRRSWLAKLVGKRGWQPQSAKSENELMQRLRRLSNVA